MKSGESMTGVLFALGGIFSIFVVRKGRARKKRVSFAKEDCKVELPVLQSADENIEKDQRNRLLELKVKQLSTRLKDVSGCLKRQHEKYAVAMQSMEKVLSQELKKFSKREEQLINYYENLMENETEETKQSIPDRKLADLQALEGTLMKLKTKLFEERKKLVNVKESLERDRIKLEERKTKLLEQEQAFKSQQEEFAKLKSASKTINKYTEKLGETVDMLSLATAFFS